MRKAAVNICKRYANFFDAMVFEKVNTESNGDEKFPVTPSFYPALHRLLTLRRNWGENHYGHDLQPGLYASLIREQDAGVSILKDPSLHG